MVQAVTKILLLFFLLTSLAGATTLDILSDSSTSEIRGFNPARLDSIRSLAAYDYQTARFSPVDVVDMVLAWLWYNLFKHIFNPRFESLWEIVIYIVAFIALFYIIRRFLQSEFSTLFYTKEKQSPDVSAISEDDIHSAPLQTLLDESLRAQKYRDAVRLLFLISLKQLADLKLIQWQAGKTNHEYNSELKSELLKQRFSTLTRVFEYVWYGEFPVDARRFQAIKADFLQFEKQAGHKP